MNNMVLVGREIAQRKVNFLLSLVSVTFAVALFVFFFTTGEASQRETTRLMRNMGFNLRIIPKETDMADFLMQGFARETMPESYVDLLAHQETISYAHLVATLQQRTEWRGLPVILTGIAPEAYQEHKQKSPMGFAVPPGQLYMGYELSRRLELEEGQSLDLLGTAFTIEKCLSETGTDDDLRIYGNLADIQGVLGMQGKINEIKALQCLCLLPGRDTLDELREQLAGVLPDAKVVLLQAMAEARRDQRIMAKKYFSLLLPVILVACAAWTGVLAMMNVKDRRVEIGVIRALGYGSGKIAFLVLSRAVLLGLIGAVLGFALGTGLSLLWGPSIFKLTAKALEPIWKLLWWSIVGAPAFASLSSFMPAMAAVTQDAAVVLKEG